MMNTNKTTRAGERTHTFDGFTYQHTFAIGERVAIAFGFARGVEGTVVGYNGNHWYGNGTLFVIPYCAVEFVNPQTGKLSRCLYREANNYDSWIPQIVPVIS